ncbi:hypothetical protein F444_02141 [Phytophthora nicotianae P1976]|uniref:DDE Tnp4 domain-containing protein n=1 Tax=Phytophthora nicotianae P1976 TaxID=1317066 RepID=A0A081AYF2_PHYNI|nr:hypothetical protein F444_02141 [Phytophthora nicotianae P1976]
MSAEVRPGSWFDRKCWQYNKIGRTLYSTIPPGTHFIGDAGYALLPGLIVPYCDREEGGSQTPRQKQFNYLHSSTRISEESTFGIWKGRFRMVQGMMSQETPRGAAEFLVAIIVQHNLMILYRDTACITLFVEGDNNDDAFNVEDFTCDQRRVGIFKRNATASHSCS